jgi:hypothetical protein
MNNQQENQIHKQALKEYKEFLTKFACKVTTTGRSKKVMLEFGMKGISSIDLTDN